MTEHNPLTEAAFCNPLDLYPLPSVVEREKLAIFGLCVPRKPAPITWEKVQQLWEGQEGRPFLILRELAYRDALRARLAALKVGQYVRTTRALLRLSRLPATWTWEILEPIVGMKTARMVGLYSVPSARVAVIDTHVRAFLAEEFPQEPLCFRLAVSRCQYLRLQDLFLEAAARRGLEPWQLDREVWQARRVKAKPTGTLLDPRPAKHLAR